jgi:hypothetical protein
MPEACERIRGETMVAALVRATLPNWDQKELNQAFLKEDQERSFVGEVRRRRKIVRGM